ncbi:hypothetical protein [Tenacibaculum sp. 190524A05c]|uniref:Lipocalin-like protein n=1 Tax=Tenacibaculum platacis TaxID=3137852 RepID=A0ABP1EEI0_9FLAO
MGKGAFITVENKSNSLLKVETGGENCMSTTGFWENLILPNTTSDRKYIEAKTSGIPCCCETKTVMYGIEKLNSMTGEYTPITIFNLNEENNNWTSDVKTKSDAISITIQPGEEDLITIIYKG